ncbi:MAG TPA: TrkA family potassium uptake protein [Kofleriaceae bacterium]
MDPDHVIVCGVGSTGKYIIEELISARVPVIAIDLDASELESIAERHPDASFTPIADDATDDEVLGRAGIASARGVVAALANDKDNLYIVVATRTAGSTARIVARSGDVRHADKLRRAGADAIVTPTYIGSMRLLSEMLRPTIVRFLDDMLRDARVMRMDEVTLGPSSPLAGTRIDEIRERFGMNVLAYQRTGETGWHYNPDPAHELTEGTILIVLGSVDQVAKLAVACVAKPGVEQ